ncbi:hypothetical protein BOX15_Mlig030141g4, partial [Macrostomum lignano]
RMVCVPCIVIPFVLWVFHRYLRPLLAPFLPSWMLGTASSEDSDGKQPGAASADSTAPAKAKCPFASSSTAAAGSENPHTKKTE